MKMLKCFGKCSSDSYVVNKPPRTQSYKQDTRNGGPKIVPLPPDPTPTNGKPHKDDVKKIAPPPPENTVRPDESIKPNGNVVLIEDIATTEPTVHTSIEPKVAELNKKTNDDLRLTEENVISKNDDSKVQVVVGSASSNSAGVHPIQSTNVVKTDEKKELDSIAIHSSVTKEKVDSKHETNNSVVEQDNKTTTPSLKIQTEVEKVPDSTAIHNSLTREKIDSNPETNNSVVEQDNKTTTPSLKIQTEVEKVPDSTAIHNSLTREKIDNNPETNNSVVEQDNKTVTPSLKIQTEVEKVLDSTTIENNLTREKIEINHETDNSVVEQDNKPVTPSLKIQTEVEKPIEIKNANKTNVTKESVVRNEQQKNAIKETSRVKESVVEREPGKAVRVEITETKFEGNREESAEEDEESEVYVDVTQLDDTKTSIEKKSKGENAKKVRIGNVEIEPNSKEVKRESDAEYIDTKPVKRRSGIVPLPVKYDESTNAAFPNYPKDPDDEVLIRKAIESNDFLNKIISGSRLDAVIACMYNKEISAKETIIKQGEKGSHMYVSAKGSYQVLVKGKVVSAFNDVRVFGELAILYNAKRLASIKAVTSGRVWVLDRNVYQQIMVRDNIKEQDEIMEFLMNNNKLNVVGKAALQEVANLLKSEFFSAGKQIVRQGDKGHKFYIIRAGTVTITKDGEGVVGVYKKGDCFGELALLKEDCRQATVTADPPAVECLTLTRKEFIAHFGELGDLTEIKARPQDSIKDVVTEHEDINLTDLKIIKTLGVGGFGRVELVQHTKKKDLVFALKYLKKIDIVLQHQQEHVYNEKNIQMASKSPFIVRLYRTYKDSKYIYLLMESCLGGDLWSLLQKQRLRRFEEKEARFIAACVLESFDYLHSRGIIYRDLKPENLLIAANGYIKLTDFGFAKKISSRGRTFTFAGTPEYVAPEIVLNKGHDRAVDYWAFGAFIFEMLTGRTPFRTDDSSHMKTYNKILNGIDNIQFPTYVNSKARHIVGKLCRPVPMERLGMQKDGIKDIKSHRWFLGFDWVKFAKCEVPSPFKPKLKSAVDTQHFDPFKKDTDIPPDELSGWDTEF